MAESAVAARHGRPLHGGHNDSTLTHLRPLTAHDPAQLPRRRIGSVSSDWILTHPWALALAKPRWSEIQEELSVVEPHSCRHPLQNLIQRLAVYLGTVAIVVAGTMISLTFVLLPLIGSLLEFRG